MLEGCEGFAELTRQQEMGRSEPNWELSTKRFYGKEDKEADAVLVPETLDLDLVLRQFLHGRSPPPAVSANALCNCIITDRASEYRSSEKA